MMNVDNQPKTAEEIHNNTHAYRWVHGYTHVHAHAYAHVSWRLENMRIGVIK